MGSAQAMLRALFDRLLSRLPQFRELSALRAANRSLRLSLEEKSRKLADADEQIVDLSKANHHLTQLAKSRRKTLREHGIAA